MSLFVHVFEDELNGLSQKEIYRYMGIGTSLDDAELSLLVQQTLPLFLQGVRCKACYMLVPIEICEDVVDFGVVRVKSVHLARNLHGCEKAALFAATLGMATEQQRRRVGVGSPLCALVLDAMGSAGIERFCDTLCEEISLKNSGYRLRPRFSPGYGDFPLEMQKEILDALGAQRKIGVSVSESLLMIPQKSVTAVVGLAKNGCSKIVPNCEACLEVNCEFRV